MIEAHQRRLLMVAAALVALVALATDASQPPAKHDLTSSSSSPARAACVPLINIGSVGHYYGDHDDNVGETARTKSGENNATHRGSSGGGQQRLQNNANFSFPIGDIDLPLVITREASSINSALKLLSTFASQLDQSMMASESGGDSDGDGDRDGHQDDDDDGQESPADSDPKFSIGLTIKNTTLAGRFSYSGPALALASGGANQPLRGYYGISIENIYLLVSSNITKERQQPDNHEQETGTTRTNSSSGGGARSLVNPMYQLKTNEFRVNVTNLGYISIDIYDSKDSSRAAAKPTSNLLLKMLQKVLQRTIKRTYFSFEHYIRRALEAEGRRALDCELTRFNHLLLANAAAGYASERPPPPPASAGGQQQQQQRQQHDDLARIIGNEIANSRLNKVNLPDFEHQQAVLGSSARITFYNGSVSGLETLRLNGSTRIKLQDEHLLMNASLGWSLLQPYYSWNLTLGNSRTPAVSQGFVSFNIKDIDFDAVITKGLNSQTRIVVEQLDIRHLDSPKMDIGGLPGMNRVTRAMVNFFMGRLKQRLTGAIQPVLRQQLERALNKLFLPN